MWKLLLILSLIPLILAFLLSQFAGFSVLSRKVKLRTAAATAMRKWCSLSDSAPELVLVKRRSWIQGVQADKMTIQQARADGDSATDHAYLWHQLGLALLAREHPASTAWRDKVIKTGYLLPPFVMMIVAMGVMVARIPIFPGIVGLIACMSFCTVMQWFNLAIELEASKRAIHFIEKQRIYKSLAEEEAVVAATRAWSYTQLIPGVMKGFLGLKG